MNNSEFYTNRLISKGVDIDTAKLAIKELEKAEYSTNGLEHLLASFAQWYKEFGSEAALMELDSVIIK